MRSATAGELSLPSFLFAAGRDPLDARTLEAIALGVSNRDYRRALDAVPERLDERSVSKSAVSRRFVALSTQRLGEWMSQPLGGLDLRVVQIDGLHFHEHVVLIALGIDAEGQKHILGLREGTTENSTVARSLLADLVERGLSTDRPPLFVIDGAKACARPCSRHTTPRTPRSRTGSSSGSPRRSIARTPARRPRCGRDSKRR